MCAHIRSTFSLSLHALTHKQIYIITIIVGGLAGGHGAIEMEVGVALDLVVADDFHSEGYRSGLQ